jgi:hypothetical protein
LERCWVAAQRPQRRRLERKLQSETIIVCD